MSFMGCKSNFWKRRVGENHWWIKKSVVGTTFFVKNVIDGIITYMFGWRDFFVFLVEVRYRNHGKNLSLLVVSQSLWTGVNVKKLLLLFGLGSNELFIPF